MLEKWAQREFGGTLFFKQQKELQADWKRLHLNGNNFGEGVRDRTVQVVVLEEQVP